MYQVCIQVKLTKLLSQFTFIIFWGCLVMATRLCRQFLGARVSPAVCRNALALRQYHAVSRPAALSPWPSRLFVPPPEILTRQYHKSELEEEFDSLVEILQGLDKKALSVTMRVNLNAYYRQVSSKWFESCAISLL